MKHIDSYEIYMITEKVNCNINEGKRLEDYLAIQKDFVKRLALNTYFVATFGTGVVALYPVVEALMKNASITITKQQVVLLTIFALAQILHVFNKDLEKIREEIEDEGVSHLITKVKEALLSINKIFSFVARGFGKIVEVFLDMIGYIGLAIPFYMVIAEVFTKGGFDINTLPQKVAALGIGTGALALNSVIKEIISKMKEKMKKK